MDLLSVFSGDEESFPFEKGGRMVGPAVVAGEGRSALVDGTAADARKVMADPGTRRVQSHALEGVIVAVVVTTIGLKEAKKLTLTTGTRTGG